MFWVTHTSDSKGSRKNSLNVFYDDCDDIVRPDVSDFAHYPFVVEAKVGVSDLKLYMTKEEANSLAFQLNVQLRESDSKWLRSQDGMGA